ncbi:MAG: peptidoglycan D,D-transpeptidase FtsI family protein [Limnochordia bacterium]|jgi:penicillin-binding protein 2|nr:penicillin-binding transpeptidase domain-containing protein [Bacillota bacterium]NLL08549.1 hypothetical protein [Bacillota bacterium]HBG09267.1 hypothetical protein [Bacillota bacterium]
MKRTLVLIAVILLVAGGGVVWWFMQRDPAEPARAFLERVAAQDFADIENFFTDDAHPSSEDLSRAFQEFGQAYELTGITLTDFGLLSGDSKEAVFTFGLQYESRYFEPISVESSLIVQRQHIFDQWKVKWQDNLPLHDYGLQAGYSRLRMDPSRGRILDRSGEILAGPGSRVTVGVQPDRISDPELLLGALQAELGLDPEYVRRQYEAPGVQGHWFVPLITVAEEEYQRVDPVLRPIPGIFFRRIEARAYPEGITTGHITGYLGEVTPEMIRDYPEREYLSGEITGRAGLESSRDDLLRGRPGYRFFVEPADGEPVLLRDLRVQEGADLELTIDRTLQELAYAVLGQRAGALVVLNAETGAILALASTPGYDPNEFIGGISAPRWQELSSDPQRPMFNRALQGLYPPGSVFKVVTVAAAVNEGLYDPSSTFTDGGQLSVQGNIVRNYQGQVFGEHTLHEALVNSINTTIAQVGLDLGADKLEEYFRRFKLNETHRLGLPMSGGQAGTPGRSRVALAWSAIGQDQVLLTPLHMAQIFSVFANGGYVPPVHLVQGEAEAAAGDPILEPETVEAVNAMLRDVVLEGTGTLAQADGMTVYGKTGTAEVVGGGSHAWFAGHTDLPSGEKIAFALLVEEGGVGGQAAAPLIREFLSGLAR